MGLYFSPAAQVELDEAFAYLEGEEPGLGYRLIAVIGNLLVRLSVSK